MTPRRLLLLIATLLIVQLGGLLHGLTHVGEDEHDGQPHAACEWCLAYVALDHGLTHTPPALPAHLAPPPLASATPRPRATHTDLPYRSRAPPAHLA